MVGLGWKELYNVLSDMINEMEMYCKITPQS